MLSFEITGIELQICGWIDYFILTLVSTHYSKRFVDMIISKNFPIITENIIPKYRKWLDGVYVKLLSILTKLSECRKSLISLKITI